MCPFSLGRAHRTPEVLWEGTLNASDPFGRRLYDLARDRGSESALRFKDRVLTFADVSEALDAIAARIGPVVGLRAIVLLPDGIASYLVHLQLYLGGGTLVPQSPASTPEQLRAVAARIRPDLLIISPALYRKYADVGVGCPSYLSVKDLIRRIGSRAVAAGPLFAAPKATHASSCSPRAQRAGPRACA